MSDVLEKEEQQAAVPAVEEPQELSAQQKTGSLKQKWANMPRKKRRRMIRKL